MHRRAFLKTAAALAAGGLATPAISQRAAARTLRFVPQADLANFDPIWNTQYVVRNGAVLIWDMLYGVDDQLQPRRQMVEAEQVSADGLVWTFRLRAGLKFHDGEPVLAKDVVASLGRWQARDNMGLMLKAIEQELVAIDDSTFRWTLKKPYRKLLVALGKIGTLSCFIMPARIAATDPFKPINEYVGSEADEARAQRMGAGARRCSRDFPITCPATSRAHGSRGACACCSTASNGSRCRIRPPRPPRSRTAKWIGGRRRSPTWCRSWARIAMSRSTSRIRWATSALSG
jgi:peptide/nickel transport system substrate-binding protein